MQRDTEQSAIAILVYFGGQIDKRHGLLRRAVVHAHRATLLDDEHRAIRCEHEAGRRVQRGWNWDGLEAGRQLDGAGDTCSREPHDEELRPAPRGVYASSKLLGEWFAQLSPRAYVLRVESLFGSPADWTGRRGTLDHIVDGLQQGREVKVFTDRIVSPSYSRDVAAATRHLVMSGAPPGVYHCVNDGHASWHDVAVEAARILDVRARLVAITVDQLPLRVARPRYCALSTKKLAAAGFAMPTWQDGLRRWLDGRTRG